MGSSVSPSSKTVWVRVNANTGKREYVVIESSDASTTSYLRCEPKMDGVRRMGKLFTMDTETFLKHHAYVRKER